MLNAEAVQDYLIVQEHGTSLPRAMQVRCKESVLCATLSDSVKNLTTQEMERLGVHVIIFGGTEYDNIQEFARDFRDARQ